MQEQEYLKLKQQCHNIIHNFLEDDDTIANLGPFSTSLLTIKCQLQTNLLDSESKKLIQEIVETLTKDLCDKGYLKLYMDLSYRKKHPCIWYTHSFKSTKEYFSKNAVVKKDILFEDTFDNAVTINDQTKKQNADKIFPGNIRITKAMYRTDEEKQTYIEESLERELP